MPGSPVQEALFLHIVPVVHKAARLDGRRPTILQSMHEIYAEIEEE
jgi:hypothetical protein